MAWEIITIVDKNGTEYKLAVQSFTQGADTVYIQGALLAFGADGSAPGNVSSSNPVPTSYTGSTFKAGQKTSIGTTAVQLIATASPGRDWAIKADPSNAVNLLVGNAADGQFYPLEPGEPLGIPIGDLSQVWVKAASGSGLACSWVGIG